MVSQRDAAKGTGKYDYYAEKLMDKYEDKLYEIYSLGTTVSFQDEKGNEWSYVAERNKDGVSGAWRECKNGETFRANSPTGGYISSSEVAASMAYASTTPKVNK